MCAVPEGCAERMRGLVSAVPQECTERRRRFVRGVYKGVLKGGEDL